MKEANQPYYHQTCYLNFHVLAHHPVHYEMFRVSKIQVKNTRAATKSECYNKKIKACNVNQETISISAVNKVLHKSQIVLPYVINSDKDMAHCFNNFYQKILNTYDGLDSSTSSQGTPLVEESCISTMCTLEKGCLDVLISPITKIPVVNKSLSPGVS